MKTPGTFESNAGIRKGDPTPLYIQLKDLIAARIADGTLKENSKLPSERDLCKIYGVSGITVRQALVDLTEGGLLFRMHGKGTYIAPRGAGAAIEAPCGRIGFLMPSVSQGSISQFIAALLSAVKRTVASRGFPLSLYTADEDSYFGEIERKELGGLLVTDLQAGDPRMAKLAKLGVPYVALGGGPDIDAYAVRNDEAAASCELTAHLIKGGRNRIGFINGDMRLMSCMNKARGYRCALERAGAPFDDSLHIAGEFSETHGYVAALKLIQAGVDAIVCVEQFTAIGAIKALRKGGLRTPEDISLAAFHHSPILAAAEPGLIMVDVFPDIIGERAAEKLMELMQGRRTERITIVPTQIVDRNGGR